MKVSICMITYNHAGYIAQAIESVLEQDTSFPFELVIGEDCSTDGTEEICLDYQTRFPDRIRLLKRDANLGMMANCVDTLKNCRGQFIALCEGDDYWTDPLKLQKQIDFLEANSEFSGSFHRIRIVDKDGEEICITNKDQKPVVKFNDLALSWIIWTPSFVFRNGVFEVPEWLRTAIIGDWFLFLLTAQHGDIGFIDETMAAYRKHDEGAWSGKSRIDRNLTTIAAHKCARKNFYPRASRLFSARERHYRKRLLMLYFAKGEYRSYRKVYFRNINSALRHGIRHSAAFFMYFTLSVFPFLGDRYRHHRGILKPEDVG